MSRIWFSINRNHRGHNSRSLNISLHTLLMPLLLIVTSKFPSILRIRLPQNILNILTLCMNAVIKLHTLLSDTI